jgi:hypothetical protein
VMVVMLKPNLSENRAAVRNYLVEKVLIDWNLLFGETKPITSNKNCQGKAETEELKFLWLKNNFF